MAGLEVADETDVERIMRWRLEGLKQAGFEGSAALAIAANAEIDLHFAIDLLRRCCPPALAVHILL